ncbi:hypothetical protein HOY82DRAFT_490545, partial [Tuber indicum]
LRIGEGNAHLYSNQYITALVQLLPLFAQWTMPSCVQYQQILAEIEFKSGFSGCIGFLDGIDIVLQYGPSYYS